MKPDRRTLTLLIDDDSTCNSISKILLKKNFTGSEDDAVEIISFDKPQEGLKYLTDSLLQHKFDKILILLDINMPLMTGWEFLSEYEHIFKNQARIKIYILTSSVSKADMDRASENPNIIDFISKPLTPAVIQDLYGSLDKVSNNVP